MKKVWHGGNDVTQFSKRRIQNLTIGLNNMEVIGFS